MARTFLPAAVTVFALLIIWLVAPSSPAAAWLISGAVAVILLRHAPWAADLGFGWPNLVRAWKSWWWAYVLCVLVFAVLVKWRALTGATLVGGVVYFAECVVQQLIYQHLVCAPLRVDLEPSTRSDWIAALLFALVHLPNPVLAPATLLWGFVAVRLFRRRRSLWAIALFQYLLSGIVYASVPYAWHHAFRIGPRYFAR